MQRTRSDHSDRELFSSCCVVDVTRRLHHYHKGQHQARPRLSFTEGVSQGAHRACAFTGDDLKTMRQLRKASRIFLNGYEARFMVRCDEWFQLGTLSNNEIGLRAEFLYNICYNRTGIVAF